MRDLTPKKFRCFLSTTCPSIFEDGEDLLVVGGVQQIADLPAEVRRRIGADETIVRIPKGLIDIM